MNVVPLARPKDDVVAFGVGVQDLYMDFRMGRSHGRDGHEQQQEKLRPPEPQASLELQDTIHT